ncbi:MAG: CsgG/HfaB family protein [Wenzhouxiangella sp.]
MATPIEHSFTFRDVDWASAGLGGIGSRGGGTIEIDGIEGDVIQAFFYWHGINWRQPEPYNSPFVTFEGEQIEGTLLGDGGTNCWPDEENGVSRAYRADVTHLIQGNGEYSFSGLSHEPGAVRMNLNFNVNGASLIVIFQPELGQPTRDLVLFDGNDSSHPEGFPGQLPGWNAVLEPIPFQGGEVIAEFHVADGQWFPEEDRGEGVTFSTDQGTITLPDEGLYWSGRSVPSLWNSRAGDFSQLVEERRLRPALGELWDVHRFDITPAFGSEPGQRSLRLEGMTEPLDCKALIALAIGLEAGTAPEAPESLTRVEPVPAQAEAPEPTPAPPEPEPEIEPEPQPQPEPEPLPEWTTDRPILAVAEFTNDATSAGWWGGGIGSELASMLASELAAINAFVVVERERLDRVLDEQDLAASGRVRQDTAAASGRLVGAQYIVMGTVTDYSENTARRGGGLNVRGPSIGGRRANIGVGGGQSEAYIAVDVRVVNATTGELVHVRTIEGRTQDSSVSLRGSVGRLGGDLARENDTPAGEAIRAALIEITDYLECEMVLQTAACQARYQERETRRRERTRNAIRF